MARLNVNPTRMELQRLKERLALASRGHKLLKDKQDGMMQEFITLIQENHKLRQAVEDKLADAMNIFSLSKAMVNDRFLGEVLTTSQAEITLNINWDYVMNIEVPQMNFNYDNAPEDIDGLYYGYANSNSSLDHALHKLYEVLPDLLQLAEVEKKCQLMADELEKTRRRVNALEHRTIPQLEETIQYIDMKLEEKERAQTTRLIKIKDMG